MIKFRIVLLTAALALGLSVVAANAGGTNSRGAGDGNSANAKLCQNGGWQSWLRSDGSAFNNQGGCVSYGAQGGLLTSFTTSTTQSTISERVDLPPIQLYFTRVIGYYLDPHLGAIVVFDSTVSSAPTSQEVANLFNLAEDAIRSYGSGGHVGVPKLAESHQSSQTALVGEHEGHTVTTVTTTDTVGPANIMIGPNRSQPFVVLAGTLNKNTNTDTQTFLNQCYQETVTNFNTYEISGAPQ